LPRERNTEESTNGLSWWAGARDSVTA